MKKFIAITLVSVSIATYGLAAERHDTPPQATAYFCDLNEAGEAINCR